MKEILTNVLTGVTCLLIGSMLVIGGRLFHQLCEQWKQKTESESLKNLIDKIDYIVQLCVESTNQTFVNDKKADNNFTDEDKQTAYQQTMESVTNMITDEDKDKIIKEFGDLGTFLKNSIENYIKTSKNI